MNLGDFEKGELEEDVTGALNKGWEVCRGVTGKYFH
jgi:aflatoxin B1 aldehyde reductase